MELTATRSLSVAWRCALAAGLFLLFLHDGLGVGGHGPNPIFDQWIYNSITVLATVGCLTRAALVQRERSAWVWIGIALMGMTGGDLIYDGLYHGNPPFPSLADISYLSFYPACYIGIGLLVRGRVTRLGASVWLDGLMAAATAATVGAALLVKVVTDSTHGTPLVVLTNLAYPLGDVLLLALVAFVFSITAWRPGRMWALLAAGLLVVTLGDGVFLYQVAMNTYREGTLVDLSWPLSLSLLALAAWQTPSRTKKSTLEYRTLPSAPIAAGLIAVAAFIAEQAGIANPFVTVFASITIVLVLIRTALTFRENTALLRTSRNEALTDALTDLPNRRKLLSDLAWELEHASEEDARVLAIFDLNGFKNYNDTFGHPAGDALLARLAAKLAVAVGTDGQAYRMGGDEFCVILPASELRVAQAARALTEHGESFVITSAVGAVTIPREAATIPDALRVADERLYREKDLQPARRGAAHEPLLRTLAEREPRLLVHLEDVSVLALAVGRDLHLAPGELDDLKLGAELHDIGKLAIPDAILQKPGPLDEAEWGFIHNHTLVGQRILSAASALGSVARIVRSTHERWDGGGYPDGLAGEEIPLAARIIAVCDAFSVMTSDRPYRIASTEEEAIAELRRCAGTQFEQRLVEALCAVLERRASAPATEIALAG